MKLTNQRKNSSGVIIGDLMVDGVHECFTLEDPDAAHDRIDAGTYNVIIDFSDRFQKLMPHIIGSAAIDDRGIRIHSGNTEADTTGCILVGRAHSATSLSESRDAFNALYEKLHGALARGEHITLEVLDAERTTSDAIPDAARPQSDQSSNGKLPPPATRPNILACLVTVIQCALAVLHSSSRKRAYSMFGVGP